MITSDPGLLAHGVPLVVTRVCPESRTYSAWSLQRALAVTELSLPRFRELCALSERHGDFERYLALARAADAAPVGQRSLLAAVADQRIASMESVRRRYQSYSSADR